MERAAEAARLAAALEAEKAADTAPLALEADEDLRLARPALSLLCSRPARPALSNLCSRLIGQSSGPPMEASSSSWCRGREGAGAFGGLGAWGIEGGRGGSSCGRGDGEARELALLGGSSSGVSSQHGFEFAQGQGRH